MKNYKLVGISESGSRVGETHHRAKLSDHDIDLIRELHEEGLSYREIALKWEIGKSTVRDIVKCRRRWQTPVTWRKVEIADERKGVEVQEPTPAKPKTLHGHCWRFPVEESTAEAHTGVNDATRYAARTSNELAVKVLKYMVEGAGKTKRNERKLFGGRYCRTCAQIAADIGVSYTAAYTAIGLLVFEGLVYHNGYTSARKPCRRWSATDKALAMFDT